MSLKRLLSILNLQDSQSPSSPLTSPKTIKTQYKYWRTRIFYSIFIGYTLYYFTRKSATFAIPGIIEELNYSNAELGILSTILYFTYGFSKFFSGIISDQVNPRYFMTVGLIITGICNLCFGSCTSLFWMSLIWGMNGIFQGWGWHPCTKQLTYWFSKKERGWWWSLQSTSHNVGGGLIPLFFAFSASYTSWRGGMFITGTIAIIISLWLMERLRSVPESLGLPAVEDLQEDYSDQDQNQNKNTNPSKPSLLQDEKQTTSLKILSEVLNKKNVWLLAFCYFFVYIVRTGMNDWTLVYLTKVRGFRLEQGAIAIAWFEAGGFLGILAAGWLSDKLFQGKRIPYIIISSLGLIPLFFLMSSDQSSTPTIQYTLMSSIGFLIFGPQLLVGLAAAEFVDKKAACTANGFAGCFAYLGAAFTGYPLGRIIDFWGWDGFFLVMLICSCICVLVGLILISNFTPIRIHDISQRSIKIPKEAT